MSARRTVNRGKRFISPNLAPVGSSLHWNWQRTDRRVLALVDRGRKAGLPVVPRSFGRDSCTGPAVVLTGTSR